MSTSPADTGGQKNRSVPIPTLPPLQNQPSGAGGTQQQPLNRRRGDNPPRPPGHSGGVMRSSLELVFSYSRSQQRFFGGLPSAPSFVNGHSFSSWSSHLADDQEGEARQRRRRWDPETGLTTTDTEGEAESYDDEDEEGVSPPISGEITTGVQPSSDSPVLFPVDPVSSRPSDHNSGALENDFGPIEGPRSLPRARPFSSTTHSVPQPILPLPPSISANTSPTSSGPNAGTLSWPASLRLNAAAGPAGQGLISFFSPKSNQINLSSSIGNSSSGSQTPRAVQHPRLHETGSNGRSSPTHPGQRAILSRVEEEQHKSDMVNPPSASESTPLLQRRKSSWGLDGISPQPSGNSLNPNRRESQSNGTATRRRSHATLERRRNTQSYGESTDFQTGFNAVAVLVGIGLLSMPLAFSYAGWIGGTIMLLCFAWITCHTAKLLARLIFADPSLQGYTDIGRLAFGRWGGALVDLLFCLELFALGVALIVLFGDSLNAIFPSISSNYFKLLCYVLILPTTLMPLRLLSIPSLLSTLSTVLLVGIVIADGLWKATSPGSLRDPMPTNLEPEWTNANWLGGVGLVLAGFGGHAVVPSLARDMKNPTHFDRVISWAFLIAASVSFIAGAAGYLMFGNTVSDEITRDLLQSKFGYPRGLNLFALWMIVINPLTKFGLSSRPLNMTVEAIFGLTPAPTTERLPCDPPTTGASSSIARVSRASISALSSAGASDYHQSLANYSSHVSSTARRPSMASQRGVSSAQINQNGKGTRVDLAISPPNPPSPGGFSPARSREVRVQAGHRQGGHDQYESSQREGTKGFARILVRASVTACCVATAIGLPGFGQVMAFLGSFSALLICIILPLAFYLRLESMSNVKFTTLGKAGHLILMLVSIVIMVAGTVWAFIPGTGHGGLEP